MISDSFERSFPEEQRQVHNTEDRSILKKFSRPSAPKKPVRGITLIDMNLFTAMSQVSFETETALNHDKYLIIL